MRGSGTIDVHEVRQIKGFLRFLLTRMGLFHLSGALALEELASEIRVEMAKLGDEKWMGSEERGELQTSPLNPLISS
jgi:hypothetical protein